MSLTDIVNAEFAWLRRRMSDTSGRLVGADTPVRFMRPIRDDKGRFRLCTVDGSRLLLLTWGEVKRNVRLYTPVRTASDFLLGFEYARSSGSHGDEECLS